MSWLAIDLDTTVSELAVQLGDLLLVDDWHRPAINAEHARALVIEHQDALVAERARQAQADRAWLARMTAHQRPIDRVAAIQARQAEMRAAGCGDDNLALIGLAAETAERAEGHCHVVCGRWRFEPVGRVCWVG